MKLSNDGKTLIMVNKHDIDSNGTCVIPSSVERIGECAFYECDGLFRIDIPEGVKEIDEEAFSGCTNLKCVTLPSTLRLIGESAFLDCLSLKMINIPQATNLKDWAFGNCNHLETVIINGSEQTFCEKAFEFCEKINKIIILTQDKDKYESIKKQLPNEFASKIMEYKIIFEITHSTAEALSKILYTPQTSPLFRQETEVSERRVQWLSNHSKTYTLDDRRFNKDMIIAFNIHQPQINKYYQKAKQMIAKIPFPATPDDVKGYKQAVTNIVEDCIKHANAFNQPIRRPHQVN